MEGLKKLCFDTDLLIDFLRGPSKEAELILRNIQERRLPASTTTINTFEVWLGVHLAKKPDLLIEETEAFLSQLEVMNFDYESSIEAGRVMARLREKGEAIDIRDIFVGCISKTNRMALVTRNIKHYQRIRGLTIVTSEELAKKLKA